MTILFFVYFGTYNNKIHTNYKQSSVFVLIFSMLLVGFISKAATTKNRQFIYDLSMLCLGLVNFSTEVHKFLQLRETRLRAYSTHSKIYNTSKSNHMLPANATSDLKRNEEILYFYGAYFLVVLTNF
jgi:hypothetical protein